MIIIFQPEIRQILDLVTQTGFNTKRKMLNDEEKSHMFDEIITAVEHFKRDKLGAKIIFERNVSLQYLIEPAVQLNADVSSQLLEAIFLPPNPLHDGGVVIRRNKIVCANSVVGYITKQKINIDVDLGTRHLSSIYISETTDALVVIVSEERQEVSVALGGNFYYDLNSKELRNMLNENLSEGFFL